jgi:hypothetical protein
VVEVLECEGLVNIAVCDASPETDNDSVGSLLGKAVHGALKKPRGVQSRQPAWREDIDAEHLTKGKLPDAAAMFDEEARTRLEVPSPGMLPGIIVGAMLGSR